MMQPTKELAENYVTPIPSAMTWSWKNRLCIDREMKNVTIVEVYICTLGWADTESYTNMTRQFLSKKKII